MRMREILVDKDGEEDEEHLRERENANVNAY